VWPASFLEAAESVRVIPSEDVTSFVRIRAEPNAASNTIGQLRPGNSVAFIGESEGWYIVERNGATGYVSRDWTRKISDGSESVAGDVVDSVVRSEAAQIIASEDVDTFVRIRAEANTASATIGRLQPGNSLPLIGEIDGWYLVERNGATGYVSRDWTRKTGGVAESAQIESEVHAAESAPPTPPTESEPAPLDPGELTEASALLDADRPEEAYALLSKLETRWSGTTEFDYLFGVAALDSGKAGEAIFALERVVRSLPAFVGARMELASALYEVGEHERARQEFTALLNEDPPEEVRGVITRYLDALTEPDTETDRARKLLYAAAVGGYDSNANGAADINDFLGFTLEPNSSETGSAFAEAQFGGLLRNPVNPTLEFSLQGGIRHRHYPSADFASHSLANTAVALGFKSGANNFITGVGAYWSALDGSFNERSVTLDLGWQRTLQKNTLQLALRAGPVRFSDAQKVRDVDRVLYTLTLRQPLQSGNGEFDWVAIGGRDRSADDNSAYGNTRFGGRFAGRWKAFGNDLSFSLGFLKIPYDGDQLFYGIDRDDQQITTGISMEMEDKPFRGWTFVPNLRYVNNDSNVTIFDYDRIEIGALFRTTR